MVDKKNKKAGGEIGYQQKMLQKYYYSPPYGTRFWVLAPFVDPHDTAFNRQIIHDFGEISNIRPVKEQDISENSTKGAEPPCHPPHVTTHP